MNTLERITGWRTAALAINGLSFATWQLAQLESLRPHLAPPIPGLLVPLAILVWIASAAYVIWQGRRHGQRSDGDELTQLHRARSLSAGYLSTTVLIAVALAASSRLAIPPADVLRTLLVAAVLVPVLTFLHMERRSDSTE